MKKLDSILFIISMSVLLSALALFHNPVTVYAEELTQAEFSRYITYYDHQEQTFKTQLELFGSDGNFYVFNLEDSTPKEEDAHSIYKIDLEDNRLSYRQYFEHTIVVATQTEEGSICTDDSNLIWWINQSYPVGVEIICTVEKISNTEYKIVNGISNYNY